MTSKTISAAIIVNVRADMLLDVSDTLLNNEVTQLIAETLNTSLDGASRGIVTLHTISSAVTLLTEQATEAQMEEEFR